MDSDNFGNIRKRMEEDFRRAQGRAEARMRASSVLSAANRAILERFRSRVDEIDRAVSQIYERADCALQTTGKESAQSFPAAPDEALPAFPPSDNPLCGLPVRALHALEKMDSHLRHSVVEVCLNNLKMFAQLAPAKSGDERFVEKVLRCIPAYPAAAAEIGAVFERPLDGGLALRALFAREYAVLSEHLAGIDAILRDAGERKPGGSFWRRFATAIPTLVDGVLAALGAVTTAIAGIRVPLVPVLRTAVNLFRPRCEEKGVALNIYDKTDRPPAVFADGTALLNAFVELLRNAGKHAFNVSSGNRKIEITAAYPDRERRRVRIEVRDNGSGMPPEILARLGQRGVSAGGSGEGFAMVTAIIRRDHFGEIKVDSKPGRGTCVTILLPVKLDL